MHRLIDEFIGQSKSKKIIMLLAFFFVLCLLLFLSVYLAGSIVNSVEHIRDSLEGVEYVEQDPIFVALNTKNGKFITGSVAVFVMFIFFYSLFRLNKKNYSGKADERGVHYMKQGTFGTSKWLEESKIDEHFTVANINNTTETIYGQLTNNGEKVVGYKAPTHGGAGNHNLLMIATAGSGKSFGYVRTSLLQAIRRTNPYNSFAVTDPKGELYKDLAAYCRKSGMEVKVLNMKNPEFSDCWDVLEETINPDTERLDSARLNSFTNIFMENSNGDRSTDFWYFSALNLISAVIGYTSYEHEKELATRYAELISRVDYKKEKLTNLKEKLENSMVSFRYIKDEIKDLAIKNNINLEYIEQELKLIEKCADLEAPYNMSQIIQTILKVEDPVIIENFEKIPKWHPAYMYYLAFKTQDKPEVIKSAIQGSMLRFRDFNDDTLQSVVSNKGIHISDINKKRTALFVITDDTADGIKTKPIVSLFFSFLFTDAVKNYDDAEIKASEEGSKNECLPLVVMLDEAFSLGVLTGSADGFGRVLSTARSRNIWISIICQTYTQIKALYGEEIGDVIQGNCKTLLYLGGNDPATLDFISKFSGESTVLSERHEELNNILGTEALKAAYTSSSAERQLITKGEAREWSNKVLVIEQGTKPIELNPFGWNQHPLYNECAKSNIYKDITPVQTRTVKPDLTKLKNEIIELNKKISDPNAVVESVNEETGEIEELVTSKVFETSSISEDEYEAFDEEEFGFVKPLPKSTKKLNKPIKNEPEVKQKTFEEPKEKNNSEEFVDFDNL